MVLEIGPDAWEVHFAGDIEFFEKVTRTYAGHLQENRGIDGTSGEDDFLARVYCSSGVIIGREKLSFRFSLTNRIAFVVTRIWIFSIKTRKVVTSTPYAWSKDPNGGTGMGFVPFHVVSTRVTTCSAAICKFGRSIMGSK
jgi:hypothetical protein